MMNGLTVFGGSLAGRITMPILVASVLAYQCPTSHVFRAQDNHDCSFEELTGAGGAGGAGAGAGAGGVSSASIVVTGRPVKLSTAAAAPGCSALAVLRNNSACSARRFCSPA